MTSGLWRAYRMNDVSLAIEEDSLASDHTRTQHILTAYFMEDMTDVRLRHQARTLSAESRDRAFVESNLPACLLQQDRGEQPAYRAAYDDDFASGHGDLSWK